MEYSKKLKEHIKSLWIDLLELSERRDYEIEYRGKSVIYNGAVTLIIYSHMFNTEYWNELIDVISRNNLKIEHWFMEAKHNEIKLYLWLSLKEV